MIPAAELARIRADTEAVVLNKRGTITQRSRAQGSQGGGADNYVAVDNVPCAITSGAIRSGVVMAGQLMSLATQTILLSVDTDVQVDARIKIDGSTYRVIGPSYVRTISVLQHVDALFDASLP
jgi:head-tail adaptor